MKSLSLAPAKSPPSERFSWVTPALVFSSLAVLLFFHGTNWLISIPLPVGKSVFGRLDAALNAQFVIKSGTITARAGNTLQLSGWVVSADPKIAIRSLEITVAGKSMGNTTDFYLRPDVASAYGRQDFTLSGWKVSVSLEEMPAGSYPLAVQAIASDGHKEVVSDLRLIVVP